jgi:hypothetical protein
MPKFDVAVDNGTTAQENGPHRMKTRLQLTEFLQVTLSMAVRLHFLQNSWMFIHEKKLEVHLYV